MLFPGVRLDICLCHALNKLLKKLLAITPPVRKASVRRFIPCDLGGESYEASPYLECVWLEGRPVAKRCTRCRRPP
jgi:hypothetical protein